MGCINIPLCNLGVVWYNFPKDCKKCMIPIVAENHVDKVERDETQ